MTLCSECGYRPSPHFRNACAVCWQEVSIDGGAYLKRRCTYVEVFEVQKAPNTVIPKTPIYMAKMPIVPPAGDHPKTMRKLTTNLISNKLAVT